MNAARQHGAVWAFVVTSLSQHALIVAESRWSTLDRKMQVEKPFVTRDESRWEYFDQLGKLMFCH